MKRSFSSPNISKGNHPHLIFNNNIYNLTTIQKRLDIILDIGLPQTVSSLFSRPCLLTIYISFARPHLHYRDVIYDHTLTKSFYQRLESIQHHAAIAITGAIRGTSSEKLY